MQPTDQNAESPVWPLGLFSATLSFLIIPIAIGSAGARVGAVFGAIGMLAGFLAGLRVTRKEHGDDTVMPSFLALARESTAHSGRVFVYIAAYLLLVFLVALAPGSGSRKSSGVAGVIVATVASGLVVASMIDGSRRLSRRDGVERQVFLEATSFAFFATVLSALAYGLFEVFADAPQLSMWVVWSAGMLSWIAASAVLSKRRG